MAAARGMEGKVSALLSSQGKLRQFSVVGNLDAEPLSLVTVTSSQCQFVGFTARVSHQGKMLSIRLTTNYKTKA